MSIATLAEQAKTLGSPNVTADTPEKPEDLRTVEQVDWQGLITAALGPTTSIDLPLPQLLLRLAETVASLAENGEHLKHFMGGLAKDQEDLYGAAHAGLAKGAKERSAVAERVDGHDVKFTKQADEIKRLTARVKKLEAALTVPDDAAAVQPEPSTVQALNGSESASSTR